CLLVSLIFFFFFFSSRRRHTRFSRDWSSDVCSSDLHVRRRSVYLCVVFWRLSYQIYDGTSSLPLRRFSLVVWLTAAFHSWISGEFVVGCQHYWIRIRVFTSY